MKLSLIAIGILTVAALGLGGCAGPVRSDTFPTPMPLDLPNGIDSGLITPGWDGSFPLRLVSFIVHPVGVALDLLVQQPFYLVAGLVPPLFGYTVQDEVYQNTTVKYQYHWKQRER